MIKYTKTIITGLFIALFLNQANAQLLVKGEFRPRAEYRKGYNTLAESSKSPACFISQRSRITMNYKNKKYRIGLSLQDARVWGDESLKSSSGVFGDNASIDLKEAWIEILLKSNSKLKIGRQFLKYDDQRLISQKNWNQNSLAYDALIYKYKNNKLQLDVGVSLNNDKENVFGNEYSIKKMKTLNFVHLKKHFNNFNISLITIGSGFQKKDSKETIYMKGTYGANIDYQNNNFSVFGSGYYQNGKNKTGQKVNAYLLSSNFGYKINKFSVCTGIDYISGDNAAKTDSSYFNKNHVFDILYGSRHRHYGYMSYFSNIPKNTDDGGLINVFAKFKYDFTKSHNLALYYHFFSLSNNVLDFTSNCINKMLKKNLGSEFDFCYTYKIHKDIKFNLGYSLMLPTETLEIIQKIGEDNSRYSYWAWAMLTVKPVFFNTKK